MATTRHNYGETSQNLTFKPHRRHVWKGVFWVAVYLLLVLTPLFVLLVQAPPGLGFWRDFSVALGFAGTAMAAMMFVLTARFRRASAPFGVDIIYYFHRQSAVVALIFIIAHPVILLLVDSELAPLFGSAALPWSLRTGLIATLLFLIIVASSLWRQKLSLDYDGWRLWHAILAPLALLAAYLHIRGVGYYSGHSWKAALWLLIMISVLLVYLYFLLVRPAMISRRPYLIEENQEVVSGIRSLTLRPSLPADFSFLAGQFAFLTIGNSPFALKGHPFSITSSASRPERLTFNIKAAGDFTSRVKEAVPGQTVYVDGPYGAFCCDRYPAPGLVFLVRGIGCAPIMGMLRTLADRGDRRPIQLIWGGRSWRRVPFTDEIEEMRRVLALDVVYVLEAPPRDWQGETGQITAELLNRRLPADRKNREYFVCGPVPMMQMAEKGLRRAGVSLTRIHSELWHLA
jgi:predicted ferric reductase